MQLKNIKKIILDGYIVKNGEFDILAPLVEKHKNQKILSFINNVEFLETLNSNKNISSIICTKEVYQEIKNREIGIIISENPKTDFFNIQNYLVKKTDFYKKEKETVIAKTARVHQTAIISSKNVEIGDNVVVGPNVVIEEGVKIDEKCIIGANSILGCESFSYDSFNKIYAGGGVYLKKNVELLGNIVIEKGIYRDTIIGDNTKINYNCIIEHDCKIGKNNLFCANVTITGRVNTGDSCYFGPGVVVRNGLEIGNNARANMGAIVTKNISEGKSVSGNFAIEHNKFINTLKY